MEGTSLISWMAWTWPTAVFFLCIFLFLVAMTVWEICVPGGDPAFVPHRLAFPQHPPSRRGERQPPPRHAATHRRAEQHHARCRWRIRPSKARQHHEAAKAVSDELHLGGAGAFAHKPHQPLGVRFDRPPAACIVEDMRAVAARLQSRRQRIHDDAGHP